MAAQGSSTNRSRGFSNIFGGISTVEQVNGFALNRQASTNSNANNSSTAGTNGSATNPSAGATTVYPTLPNTSERDLQTNIQNYNNLLEQQIFEIEEETNQDVITDEQRNLSLSVAGTN